MKGIVVLSMAASGVVTAWVATVAAAGVTAGSMPEPLQGSGYGVRAVGYSVRCLDNDSVCAEYNADSMFIPASVAKTVTATAAFDLLGPGHVFRTDVYLGGEFEPDTGLVRGDMYVRGTGDPGFVAERTWLFVQQLVNRGVRQVRGACILCDGYFDTATVGPGFGEESSSRAYEAPVGALSVNFSTVEVHTWPGSRPGSPVGVRVFPAEAGLEVISKARTVGAGEGRKGVSVRTEQRGASTIVVVEGDMAVGAEPRCAYRKVWETSGNVARVLSSLFAECGLQVAGGVRPGVLPDSIALRPAFHVFESLPLSTYVGYLFKYSNNAAAEMLFRTIGAERSGSGSWDSAAAVVRRWWRERGLPGELRQCNGSGMGSCSRLSPRQAVALLAYVDSQKVYLADFCAGLSVAGVDGTLKDRFTRSRLRGFVRAKTGTLNNKGVSSLAGYAFRGSRTYAFAIFVSDIAHGQFDHWMLQERILESVLP